MSADKVVFCAGDYERLDNFLGELYGGLLMEKRLFNWKIMESILITNVILYK